jgi:hypothetical protein
MAHKTLNWDDSQMYQQIELAIDRSIADLALLTKSEASKVIEDFQTAIDRSSNNEEF